MSSANDSSSGKGNVILGLIVLALGAAGLFYAARAAYRWINPPPPDAALSLSAFFEKSAEAYVMRIEGEVQRQGKQIGEGQVAIAVNKLSGDFRQSFIVHLQPGGKFSLVDSPALRTLTPRDRLYVEAQVWAEGEYIGAEEVYLAASKPLVSRRGLLWSSLTVYAALVLGFLWAFTGNQTLTKNRLAIACTYLVILVYLSAPLVLPVLLQQSFPDLENLMQETPVGLVQGITATQRDDPKAEPQWYLNIGGVVRHELQPDQTDRVVLAGGLAIPFFILVLSCISGAINMTRKIPQFSNDALRVESLGQLLTRSLTTGLQTLVGKPAAPPTPVPAPPTRPPGPGGKSVDTELWRVGLIKQYMYLVSAPFLAIATYYLLLWLDLTPKPVIVLVSFSVGLISDQIVERIITVVKGLLNPDAKKAPGRPAAVALHPVLTEPPDLGVDPGAIPDPVKSS